MLDGIKIELPNDEIFNLPFVEPNVKLIVAESTANIDKTFGFNNLFRISKSAKGVTSMRGSVHKYSHDGFNHTDFTISDVVTTVKKIINQYELNPNKCIIKNIECGVNIQIPYEINKLFPYFFLLKTTQFDKSNGGQYLEVSRDEYSFKIYNKSLFFDKQVRGLDPNLALKCPKNLMRIEIKSKRKKTHSDKWGITTLNDLLQTSKWFPLVKSSFKERWKETLMFDPTLDKDAINTEQYFQWSNHINWINCEGQTKKRRLDNYKKALLNHSNQLHKVIGNTLLKKLDELNSK